MQSVRHLAATPTTSEESTANVYFYRVYGRDVESNVEIPGFQLTDPGHTDITVVWPDVASGYPGLDDADAVYTSHYHPAEGGEKSFALFEVESGFVARWEDICDFEVFDDGSRIVCHPWPGAVWGEVNPFVQGRILPLALNFQGAVTLHGAAVMVDGGVVALLGTSGTGKSTLSASFHSLGHTLVADDLVAVWQDSEVPTVEWGPNHVRLDERSVEFISGRMNGSLDSEPDYDKTRVTLRSSEADLSSGAPLRTIYLLHRVARDELEGPEIVELSSIEALPTIVQGISNRSILDKKRLGEQFSLITRMLNQVPVKHLRYPSDMALLPEVCKAVNEDR